MSLKTNLVNEGETVEIKHVDTNNFSPLFDKPICIGIERLHTIKPRLDMQIYKVTCNIYISQTLSTSHSLVR